MSAVVPPPKPFVVSAKAQRAAPDVPSPPEPFAVSASAQRAAPDLPALPNPFTVSARAKRALPDAVSLPSAFTIRARAARARAVPPRPPPPFSVSALVSRAAAGAPTLVGRTALEACDFAAMPPIAAQLASLTGPSAEQVASLRVELEREIRADEAFEAARTAYAAGDLSDTVDRALDAAAQTQCEDRLAAIARNGARLARLRTLLRDGEQALASCDSGEIGRLADLLAPTNHPRLAALGVELSSVAATLRDADNAAAAARAAYFEGELEQARDHLAREAEAIAGLDAANCVARSDGLESRRDRLSTLGSLLASVDRAVDICDGSEIVRLTAIMQDAEHVLLKRATARLREAVLSCEDKVSGGDDDGQVEPYLGPWATRLRALEFRANGEIVSEERLFDLVYEPLLQRMRTQTAEEEDGDIDLSEALDLGKAMAGGVSSALDFIAVLIVGVVGELLADGIDIPIGLAVAGDGYRVITPDDKEKSEELAELAPRLTRVSGDGFVLEAPLVFPQEQVESEGRVVFSLDETNGGYMEIVVDAWGGQLKDLKAIDRFGITLRGELEPGVLDTELVEKELTERMQVAIEGQLLELARRLGVDLEQLEKGTN